MKAVISLIFFGFLGIFSSSQSFGQLAKYKCMLQLTNYEGLEAYVVVSLIDENGNYKKTMYVFGTDKQWYNGFKEWEKALAIKKEKVDGITGASIASGDRGISVFTLDESLFNKGYKLRFETAVEDKAYHTDDVEISLTTADVSLKTEGKGYIRYVKLNKIQ